MKIKLLVLLLILCIGSFRLLAQDFHNSQFHSTPLVLNPASTGVFLGEVRLCTDYRKQWSSMNSLSTDYRTASASVDGNFWKRKNKKGNFMGLGAEFFSDREGDSHIGITSVSLTGSFIKSLSPLQDHFLSIAGQAGYNQKSVSSGGLRWDNQWNIDHYDSGIPGEDVPKSAMVYYDFKIGAMYFYTGNDWQKYHVGLALDHLSKPASGFYGADNLKRKIILHGGGSFASIHSNKIFQPSFLFTKQGRVLEFTFGSYIKYVIHPGSIRTGYLDENAISFGAWYRVKDAIIFAVKYDYHCFAIGVSYDLNLSGLTPASTAMGGPEISISYSPPAARKSHPGQYKNVRYL